MTIYYSFMSASRIISHHNYLVCTYQNNIVLFAVGFHNMYNVRIKQYIYIYKVRGKTG